MKAITLLSFLMFLTYGETKIFKDLYGDKERVVHTPNEGDDVGVPLILTDFIRNGSIAAGQRAALVQNPIFQNVKSYAGYFRVDDAHDSNLWFWFFPSAGNVAKDPLVLWLDGGPGDPCLSGVFAEHGPFIVNDDGSVTLREYSWHKNHSLIYMDNPVGTGYSFTTKGGLALNETKVGQDLYSGLYQFFQLFPDFRNNPFYIGGVSYAGKYVPAIGYTIMKKNPVAKQKINLQGLLVGNGWTDPINQMNYGSYVYQLGLVGSKVKKQMDECRDEAIQLIKKGDFNGAVGYNVKLMILFQNASHVNTFNYLASPYGSFAWVELVARPEIRKLLHVGNTTFPGTEAGPALAEDMLKSVAPWLEELLEKYRVLIYVGQLDIMVGYPMVVDYLELLKFSGAESYRNSDRDVWYVDEDVAGYVRKGGLLTEILVRNAGHIVTIDQPKWGYDLVYKFTRNMPFA